MTVRTIDEIFRDFVTDGVPASGPFNPHKPDIRDTLKALTEGGDNFPDNRVIRLNNADEGTANNIVVTASVAIPAAAYQVLYILNVTQENTGPVTVSGAINRGLVTNINQPVPAGYLTPGMALLCIDTGTELRLLSYGDAEAVQAAAEAAADRAEDAAAEAEAAAGGLLSNFDTVSSVQSANIPSIVSYIRTSGYSSVGDGGGALYRKRSTPEIDGYGDIVSNDGSRWAVVLSAELDIRQFGGKLNDDAFDNGPILEQVLKLGTVKIPANSFLNCLSTVDVSNIHTVIVGASTATSEVRFTGSINGFVATHEHSPGGTPPYLFTLTDVALTTTNDPAATQNTAVNIAWHKGFTAERHMTHGSCERVAFRGVNTEQMGWGTCVSFDNPLNYAFIDVFFNGKDEGGAADQSVVKKTRSHFGVYLSGGWVPCEVRFVGCQAYHLNTVIYTTGSYEGLYVADCAFVAVGTAIDQVATTFDPDWPGAGGVPISAVGRPWITVKGTHMNVYRRAIASNGVVQGSVELSALYHSDGAEEDGVLVTIQNGHDWNIRGNIFRSYAKNTLTGNGVFVGPNADHVNITDNNFETKGTGIWISSASNGNNRERNNTFKGSYAISAIYEEAPNKLSHGSRSISLYRTSSHAVANGGGNVPWDTIEHNDFASFTVGQSGVVIAPGSGIKRVRVTGGCIFDANATGARQLQIRKNNVQGYVGAAMTSLVSGGSGSCPLNVASGVLNVSEGDTLSLFAYQDSGVPLNVQGSGLTWINIEVIE